MESEGLYPSLSGHSLLASSKDRRASTLKRRHDSGFDVDSVEGPSYRLPNKRTKKITSPPKSMEVIDLTAPDDFEVEEKRTPLLPTTPNGMQAPFRPPKHDHGHHDHNPPLSPFLPTSISNASHSYRPPVHQTDNNPQYGASKDANPPPLGPPSVVTNGPSLLPACDPTNAPQLDLSQPPSILDTLKNMYSSVLGAIAPSAQPPNHTPTAEPLSKNPSKKKSRTRGEPELCAEQHDLVNLILSGSNVFYTGSAGCGKSTVLRAAVAALKAVGKSVKIVAPTGRAAVDIGGQTIHAYAGITPDSFKLPLEKFAEQGYRKNIMKRMAEDTDVLIIDEISMVENFLLERLSALMKAARRSDKPFGGVQAVFLGDFYQLPPVKPFSNCLECGRPTSTKIPNQLYKCMRHGEFKDEDKWAFRSKVWEQANFRHVNLTNIHRQKDKRFIDILEKCRTGQRLTDKEKDKLLNHKCNVDNAVRLFATRAEVRNLNDHEFSKLTTPQRTFKCLDGIHILPHHAQQLRTKAFREQDGTLAGLKEHRFERLLEMKKGMLVILLVNLDMTAGLINGSQGVVIDWIPHDPKLHVPVVFDDKRARDRDPTRLTVGGDYADVKINSVKEFIKNAPIKEWPVVKFDNGVTRTVIADCVVSQLGDEAPYSYQCRTQIPLLPAWAMSIHKSQGMTLSKVIVNLARNFEEGQMYVALSRAKSLAGLKVEALGRESSGSNEQVMEFLREKFGRAGEGFA